MKTILFSIILALSLLFLNGQEVYSLAGEEGKGIQFTGIDEIQSQKSIWEAATDMKSEGLAFRNERFDAPNSKLVASMAYDAKTQNIIYMPMMSSFVYFKNSKNGKLISIDGIEAISATTCNQGTQFSRMTMAADGMAYTLSNDFQELIQINPKTQQISNLGAVKVAGFDAIKDHSLWGGDMVADSQGNLYVISAKGNVFKISINSMQAQFYGQVQGLAEGYTTNGAAVLANGLIVVSNAKGQGVYTFDLKDLEASRSNLNTRASHDLASAFLIPVSSEEVSIENVGIQIYPTIVRDKSLNVRSDNDHGKLNVQVYDMYAHLVDQFQLDQVKKGDALPLSLQKLRPNIYIVKIMDESGTEVLEQKITVSR